MIIHATADDLANWIDDNAPAHADQLLRRASLLVNEVLLTACYPTDDDGIATDTDVLRALSNATCAHAAQMAAAGIDPAGGLANLPAQAASKALGPANISIVNAGQLAAAKAELYSCLCSESMQILADAQLINNEIVIC